MAETLKGTVRIRVTQNVTLENLHHMLDRIVGISGCRTCGLGGIDLHLSGDPVELQEVAKLPGVQSVSFGS
jgi:hypothetical protein